VGRNYIALAIPFFFLLIGVELVAARWRGRRLYRFADALADLGCGITQQVLLLSFGGALLLAYAAVYERARLFELGRHPVAAWLVAFVAVDFIYYWWHRASHRVNFLWAAHVVHHQSEDYNLAVALRQGVLTPLTAMPFALPLALAGVPPLVYVTASAFNTLYQFWIHTELVESLGPLERVLNTPRHHRVHHARNPDYLDRNYGAVLIVWDRLFGTYAPERERPDYGVTRPLRSFNALWAQIQPLAELASWSRGAPRWRDRLAVWLAPPERSFPWSPHPAPPGASKYDVAVSPALRRYVVVNFALAVAGTFALMMWGHALGRSLAVASGVLVLAAVLSLGGLVEARPWARPLELTRLCATAGLLLAIVVA
jgi:alkylglycerol monooxygenase